MQLHPAHFPTLWHSSNNNSDLSMQWRPLSRHHSNSGGSMESLETPPPPSQSYFDSQLSPVDPAIFNNKRDSAYSSFSASSNTSDYTVSLRPDDSSSMDNILQGLGPGRPELRPPSSASGPGDLQEEPVSLKSRLAFLRPEVKTRPSSYSYEDEHRGPPQPPARKDSFRATRARPGVLDKRCTSAPVGIPTPPSCLVEDQQRRHTISEKGNGFENGKIGRWRDSKGSSLETYYIITSDTEPCTHQGQDGESKNNLQENHLQNLLKGSPSPMPQLTESLTAGSDTEKPLDVQFKPENNHLFGSHQYSPTENLLATQVQLGEFCNDQSDGPLSDHNRWSQPLLAPPEEQRDPSSPDSISTNKWSGSRCSTPGSSDIPRWVKPSVDAETLNASAPPPHVWGRSISVPGEQVNGFPGSARSASSYSPALEQQFQPISSAVSMDAMLEECHENKDRGRRDEDGEILKPYQKSSAARQLRSSKSRRRNERFATNLRNEIQRKKAELQKSRSPVGLLDCGETVKEEESSDFLAEGEETLKREDILIPPPERQPSDYPGNPHVSHSGHEEFPPSEQLSKQLVPTSSHPTAILHQPLVSPPRDQRPSGLDAACIVEHLPPKLDYGRKVEEVSGASKARRWHFTPENKLQPETDPVEKRRVKGEAPLPPSRSGGPPRTNPPPFSRSSSRRDVESDILPFADRRKFFEETSRNLSHSVSNLSRMNMPPQKTERSWCQPNTSTLEPARPPSQQAFRRFSYQGGLQQDGLYRSTGDSRMDNRRQFVSASPERNRGRDRACDSGEENDLEKLREAAREKVRELEKLREMEREMELEQERKREKEIKSELLQREWARERDHDSKIERLQPTDKHSEHMNTYNKEQWEMESESPWRDHGFYSDSVAKPVIQDSRHRPHHSQSLQPSHCYQTNGHADSDSICSAFNPVGAPVHSNTQSTPPQYTLRSYTPPEAYPVSEREQTKLNRKFSLTERDYAQCRQDRHANGVVYQGYHGQRRNRVPVSSKSDCFFSSPLRSRAMSENNLSLDQWSSHRGGMSKSPVLKEEEGRAFLTLPKPKSSPPPRPPPPKWDQFYRRRASHHSLFPTSTPPRSSPLHSQPEAGPASHLSAPEVGRQRAYSLPPREGPVSCPPCQERPPPAPFSNHHHSQRAFRPVVPAPKEKATPFIPPEQCTRLYDAGTQEDQSPLTVLKPVSWKHRGTAEWDCSSTQEHFSRDSSPGMPPGASIHKDNNTYEREHTPESYLTMEHLLPQQQQHQQHPQRRGSGTPQLSYRQQEPPKTCTEPARQEPDAPIETDIDDLAEGETLEDCKKPELQGEMQCFACPITVLETDVDAPPQTEAPEVEVVRMGPKTSPVEQLPVERSGGTLERSSGPGSDGGQPYGTTHYRKSAANTQLFNQMNASLNMSNIVDEELNYKRQLMESLRKKLTVLLEAQRGLQEDIRANVQLGEEIEALVMTVCKPNEVDKFRMFIGDLEKVVSLRLSLSGRLLRVESALDCLGMEAGHHERLPLLEKKQQLLLQLGEAQELKEHVDRREEAVGRVLAGCLTPEQLRDYKHFVKMKAALLVEQRQLDDKIRLGEEQLRGLRESLGPGGVMDFGH
ncbi:protein Shroom4 isoform X2 [Sardina pilchardus]